MSQYLALTRPRGHALSFCNNCPETSTLYDADNNSFVSVLFIFLICITFFSLKYVYYIKFIGFMFSRKLLRLIKKGFCYDFNEVKLTLKTSKHWSVE